jgi:cell division septation protein DedD
MSRQVVSRSQRRLEKKQTLVLVVLGLLIALVSYGLGVMVGRSGGDTIVQEDLTDSGRIAIAVPETVPVPGSVPDAETSTGGAANPPLTFYETLPEGSQPPMGSGINLPPRTEEVGEAPVDVLSDPPPAPAAVAVKPAPVEVKHESVKPRPATTNIAPPPAKKIVSAGNYVIQVASVQNQAGAQDLNTRLSKNGYAAFVEKTDLGSKGIWYRVYVGPFASREAADGAASTLKSSRLATSPIVRKQ